ncbi:hypothetical protein BHE74_00017976 [Ensete ventricosum]|nr:hypothetical protein GW17_00024472 [Ensete ventricosum]RWW74096.1 hypothetical protein BHE74_00017976 [Ensete ventricosum]
MKKTDSKTSEAKASEVKWTTELAPEPPAGAAEHLGQGSTVVVLPAAGDSSSPGGTHDGQTAGAASRSGGASRTGKHRGGAPCCRRSPPPSSLRQIRSAVSHPTWRAMGASRATHVLRRASARTTSAWQRGDTFGGLTSTRVRFKKWKTA